MYYYYYYYYLLEINLYSCSSRLTLYDLLSKEWKTLMDNPLYASYSIVSPHPDGRMIAVGNIHGSLMLLFPQEGLKTCMVFW